MKKSHITLFMPPIYKNKALNLHEKTASLYENFLTSKNIFLEFIPYESPLKIEEKLKNSSGVILPGLSIEAFEEDLLTKEYFAYTNEVINHINKINNGKRLPLWAFCMAANQLILNLKKKNYKSLFDKSLFEKVEKKLKLESLIAQKGVGKIYSHLDEKELAQLAHDKNILAYSSFLLKEQESQDFLISSYYTDKDNNKSNPASIEFIEKPYYGFFYNPPSIISHKKKEKISLKNYNLIRNFIKKSIKIT